VVLDILEVRDHIGSALPRHHQSAGLLRKLDRVGHVLAPVQRRNKIAGKGVPRAGGIDDVGLESRKIALCPVSAGNPAATIRTQGDDDVSDGQIAQRGAGCLLQLRRLDRVQDQQIDAR
jgi:hypothetical protein